MEERSDRLLHAGQNMLMLEGLLEGLLDKGNPIVSCDPGLMAGILNLVESTQNDINSAMDGSPVELYNYDIEDLERVLEDKKESHETQIRQ